MNMILTTDQNFLNSLKVDGFIYCAEYNSGKREVRAKEFKIKYIHGNNSTIESVKPESFLCDLRDTEFPKVTIRKADVSRGYYATKKQALEVFSAEIEKISKACQKALSKIEE
jgi:hypothetical protein